MNKELEKIRDIIGNVELNYTIFRKVKDRFDNKALTAIATALYSYLISEEIKVLEGLNRFYEQESDYDKMRQHIQSKIAELKKLRGEK